MAPATATDRASAYKTASKAVVTETEPAAPEPSKWNNYDYVGIRVPRERMAPVDYELTETVQYQVSQSAGPKNAAQFFTPIRCSCPHPRRSRHVVIPAQFYTRVARSYSQVEVVIRAWIRGRPNRAWKP